MANITEELRKRILVLDGAMGTMLQQYNFSEEILEGIVLRIIHLH